MTALPTRFPDLWLGGIFFFEILSEGTDREQRGLLGGGKMLENVVSLHSAIE